MGITIRENGEQEEKNEANMFVKKRKNQIRVIAHTHEIKMGCLKLDGFQEQLEVT